MCNPETIHSETPVQFSDLPCLTTLRLFFLQSCDLSEICARLQKCTIHRCSLLLLHFDVEDFGQKLGTHVEQLFLGGCLGTSVNIFSTDVGEQDLMHKKTPFAHQTFMHCFLFGHFCTLLFFYGGANRRGFNTHSVCHMVHFRFILIS